MASSTPSRTIGAYDAKTRFSELLERVEQGEEVVITRHGSPVARMVPVLGGRPSSAPMPAEVTRIAPSPSRSSSAR